MGQSWASKLAYFEKRISSNGTKRWRARVRRDGHPEYSQTFSRKTDAKVWASEIETRLDKGNEVPTKDQKRITISDVIERYITEYLPIKPHNKDAKDLSRLLREWEQEIGKVALLNLTPDMVVKIRDKLAKSDLKPATVNRKLGALSTCLGHCIKEWHGYMLKDNPLRRVSRLEEPDGRERYLSEKERKDLLDACKEVDQELYEIVVLALTTGMRKGEIEKLKWIHVDFERQSIRVVDPKNGESRVVPLVGSALKLLEAKHEIAKTPYVFAELRQKDRLHKRFKQAIALAELEDFRFHDLRHTAASYLAMSGATLSELSDVLGHKTLAMVKRYSHFTTEHNKELVQRMVRSVGL